MELEPLVSVIIPCYNVSSFVEEAVKSILLQTYTKLEIWLIDDASEDDTLHKISAIKDDRIKLVVYEKNTQKVGAVNDVLKIVNGQFICFQDADDYSVCDRIEKQINEFKKDNTLDICFTNFSYEIGNYRHHNIALSNDELKDEFCRFWDKKNKQLGATVCPTMMITKDVLDIIGGYHLYFKGRVGEDIHWIYRILKNGKGICIDEPLYHYTLRNESLTGLQFTGKNAKAAYSWQLLTKIIFKDINENVDLLSPNNFDELRALELLSCEEVLVEKIRQLNYLHHAYENSANFKLGKFVLFPFRLVIFFFSKK